MPDHTGTARPAEPHPIEAASSALASLRPPLAHLSRLRTLPLTESQIGALSYGLLGDGGAATNIRHLFRLDGNLALESLQYALDSLVKRHEALRTIVELDAEPHQIVLAPAPVPVDRVDMTTYPAETRQRTALEYCRQQAWLPFEPTKDQPLRVTLVELSQDCHLLLLVLSHIACDGYSAGILVSELGELYTSHLLGRDFAKRSPPFQFADYATWVRSWRNDDAVARALRPMRDHFAGSRMVSICGDRPRPARFLPEASTVMTTIPLPLTTELTRVGDQHHATLFMVLLAGLGLALNRMGSDSDVVISVPMRNRHEPSLRDTVGNVVVAHLLRFAVEPEGTFVDTLRHARDAVRRTVKIQDVNYSSYIDVDSTRLMPSVVFAWHDHARQTPKMHDLDANFVHLLPAMTKAEIFVSLGPSDSGIHVEWTYARAVYEEETVQRLADEFLRLLEAAVQQHDVGLPGWSYSPYQEFICARLGQMQVVDEPLNVFDVRKTWCANSTAVHYPGGTLSYGELEERSRALARMIRQQTDLREVCLDAAPGPELVIAMVGAFFAGVPWRVLHGGAVSSDEGKQHLVRVASEGRSVTGPSTEWIDHWIALGRAQPDSLTDVVHSAPTCCSVLTSGQVDCPAYMPVPSTDLRLLATHSSRFLPTTDEIMAPGSQPFTARGTFEIWLALLRGAALDFGRLTGRGLVAPSSTTMLLSEAQLLEEISRRRHPFPGVKRILLDWNRRTDRWSRFAEGEELDLVLVLGLDFGIVPLSFRPASNQLSAVEWVVPGRALQVLDKSAHPPPTGVPGRIQIRTDGGGLSFAEDWGIYSPDGGIVTTGRFSPSYLTPAAVAEQHHLELMAETVPGVQAAVFLRGQEAADLTCFVAASENHRLQPSALADWFRQRVASELVPRTVSTLEGVPTTLCGSPDLCRLLRGDSPKPRSAARERLAAMFKRRR